jgi:hypothetical protein
MVENGCEMNSGQRKASGRFPSPLRTSDKPLPIDLRTCVGPGMVEDLDLQAPYVLRCFPVVYQAMRLNISNAKQA